MRLIIILAIAGIVYYIWNQIKGTSNNPLKVNYLREKILLLLRGNEEAFQRMYERERQLYPDLTEWELLTRILDKLENDR